MVVLMKNLKNLLLFLLLSSLFTSCFPSIQNYYQFYKTNFDSDLKLTNSMLEYEDQNCVVRYNFFAQGGSLAFVFYNKTDKNIYIDLSNSYVIMNGIAEHYYKNRIFTNSTSSTTEFLLSETTSKSISGINIYNLSQTNNAQKSGTYSSGIQTGLSVAFVEEKTICIPPQTSKVFSEFNINKDYIVDCDLQRNPNRKNILTKKYTKSESPLVFSNIIKYKFENSELNTVKNNFYVSEITNYPESEVMDRVNASECGKKSFKMINVFKINSPDLFYNIYYKTPDASFRNKSL